jgi:hypothetical protein
MLPIQRIPESKKDKDWRKANVDSIVSLLSFDSFNNEIIRKRKNYDLVNGIIDEKEYDYVTKFIGLREDYEYPIKLHNFNIIKPIVDRLKGIYAQYINRAFGYDVYAINEEAINIKNSIIEKYEVQKELKSLIEELKAMNIPFDTDAKITEEDFNNFINNKQKLSIEELGKDILDFLKIDQEITLKIIDGLNDLIITDSEIYKIEGNEEGRVRLRRVDPTKIRFLTSSTNNFLHDAEVACEYRRMSISEVIDEFREYLTNKDIQELDILADTNIPSILSSLGEKPIQYIATTNTAQFDQSQKVLVEDNGNSRMAINSHPDTMYSYFDLNVWEVEWKSFIQVYLITKQEGRREYVEFSEEMPKQKNYKSIERVWIPCVWEGTKIGESIYVRIQRKDIDYRRMDDLFHVELSYTGILNTKKNTIPLSIVDMGYSYQHLVNVCWTRLQHALAISKGKIFVYDISKLPKSSKMSLEDVLYAISSMGIAFIDSTEINEKHQGNANNFITSVDMTLSQAISQYIEIISFIKSEYERLIGIPRQALGDVGKDETKAGIEISLVQSSAITEYIYYIHSQVVQHVLRKLLYQAKHSYKKGKKIQFITSAANVKWIDIQPDSMDFIDYGVNIVDASYTNKQLAKLEELSKIALQSGSAKLGDIINTIRSNSLAEIESQLVAIEKRREEEEARQKEQIQKLEQSKFDWERNFKEKELQAKIDIENNKIIAKKEEVQMELQYQLKLGDLKTNEARAKDMAEKEVAESQKNKEIAEDINI